MTIPTLKVLSGKPVANRINSVCKQLIADYSLVPHMLLIQIGSDPASSYYVQSIVASGAKLGCLCTLETLPPSTTQAELLTVINIANHDPNIHGIMIQKPLPRHIDDNSVNIAIAPSKDLDCLHPENLGRIMLEVDGFLPCTPAAVMYCLHFYNIDPEGKNLVIVGRSNVVGKPLANMLLWKKAFANATVTVCHSRTVNLSSITASADIIITAIGKANFLTGAMVKENAIIIDVGINEVQDQAGNSTYVGDAEYNSCYDKALAITPVPGGIGRITTSVLYLNLIKACLDQQNANKTIDEYIALIFSANSKEY